MNPSLFQVAEASDEPILDAFPIEEQLEMVRSWNASLPPDTSTPVRASGREERLVRRRGA